MTRKIRNVKIGKLELKNNAPIYIQSMTNTKTADRQSTLQQILSLTRCGCDIVRFSVPDEESAKSIPFLKENTSIPLVADIHFDYRLALQAAELGIDKIRINPGNIGDKDRIKKVVQACKSRNIPIRVGVNSGSVEKHLLKKYGAPTPEALCESALYHVRLLEQFDFYDTVVSIKASDVKNTIEANRLFAQKTDYPMHIGVTEAGTEKMGIIKSAVGIGSLLCDGIGNTIRVSLTAPVEKEVSAARALLKAIGLCDGVDIVSCPTCARTNIDVQAIATKVEQLTQNMKKPLRVAVMGCAVNGPGEAKEADIGIAGGVGEALLFKKGEIVCKIKEQDIIDVLMKEIEKMQQ